MHSRKRMQDEVIVLNEEQGVIRNQNQVAQTFNEHFSNITRSLIVNKYTAIKEQSMYLGFHQK